jgi:hypothetical protein
MSLFWSLPVEKTPTEEWILKLCKKAKLFVFLREHRHELFDEAFQAELAGMYQARDAGKPIATAAVTELGELRVRRRRKRSATTKAFGRAIERVAACLP